VVALADIIGRGDTAGRPAAGTEGRLYYDTDDEILYRDNGATWESVEAGSTGAALTVQEVDGTPSDTAVTIIRVTNGKLTDNGSGDVTLDLSGGGGGGASIDTGTHAARPAAGTAGDLYLPDNGRALYRDTGAAWAPWGPLYPYTEPPAVASWSWVNQGSSVATDTQGGIYMTIPVSASENLRCLVRTPPATPYTVTAVLFGIGHAVATNSIGLVHRQSSDGKITYFDARCGAGGFPTFAVANYNTATSFSAEPTNKSQVYLANPLFFRMTDDGTNRIYSFSHDGVTWTVVYTVARLTFLTSGPDQIGWACDASNASAAPAATLASWKVE
jgi:hypothetical protein